MKEGNLDLSAVCHECSSERMEMASGYSRLMRVTSDCKPWGPGGELGLCHNCGLIQAITTSTWKHEAEQIYKDYTIYYQSGGIEQSVFSAGSGAGQTRSSALLAALRDHVGVPATGDWLDVGCGNGALLKTCSQNLAGWRLFGLEVSEKNRQAVEKIPGVKGFFIGSVDHIEHQFDVISMNHVIEHIPGPGSFLNTLTRRLKPGGLIVLEVPDCLQNFFMLLVADHCSHFSTGMLRQLTAEAGYEVLHATNTWISKEITVIGRKSTQSTTSRKSNPPMDESKQVWQGEKLLQNIPAQLEPILRMRPFGIFGTANAATWLHAQSGNAAEFFVDEDLNRIGKQHLGRPIISPVNIPDGASVYLALPPLVAQRVAARLQAIKPAVRFFHPDASLPAVA